MAFVSSMSYTSEAQFYEAVERAKAAQTSRDIILAEKKAQVDFQAMLSESMNDYSTPVAASTASTPAVTSEELESYFQQAANTYGVSIDLLKTVAWNESNYIPDVVSSAGAVGIMQLMPSTAEYLGVTNPYNPEQNIMGGAKLLAELSNRYNNNLDLVLAAYSSGTGSVASYGGVPPYAQSYVNKIKASLGM